MEADLQAFQTCDDDGITLETDTLLHMYREMLRARRLDERSWILHRQGKVPFHISGIGHEAIHIAIAFAVRKGHDYILPYYRDLGLNLALGFTPREFLISMYGKEGETTSAARQMPSHWSSKDANIVSHSSPVATQVPHAAGMALAAKLRGEDRVALTTLGEGSTSQGDWYEGLNWAGIHNLPMVCVVENNVYAISVPVEMQMAVPNVADRAAMFGMPGIIVDGNDVLACYRVIEEAVERARQGGGPTLVEAKTYRMTPHSSDDDDTTYRSRDEVTEWKRKDPLMRYQRYLRDQGILTDEILDEMEKSARAEIDAAQKAAEEAPYPPPEAAMGDVFAPLP